MIGFIEEHKKRIEPYIRAYLGTKAQELGAIDPLGEEACNRLLDFITKGKMLRGSLVFVGNSLFAETPGEAVVTLAAVMEIIQSGLLVHDDIMDRDTLRRGDQSVFYRYVKASEEKGIRDAYHTGEALGICIGDMAFFLAFGLLAKLDLPLESYRAISTLISSEIAGVTAAQMLDVARGASGTHTGEESVLRLYRYKTGRYTFSLPLALGALAAGESGAAVAGLEEIGEILGVAFQIKDDEIGLFGDERVTGKPAGSDIKEGKNTLYSFYLLNHTKGEDKRFVQSVFSAKRILKKDIERILGIVDSYGISRLVAQSLEEYSCIAGDKLEKLKVKREEAKAFLMEIIGYNLKRTY